MSQASNVSDTSGGGNDIRTITGDSGGPVAGDASFNVDLLGGAGVNVVGNPGTNTLTISLTGGSAAIDSLQVDAFTAPGTNPVLPDALGLVTVRGGTTSAGTTPVQTNSLAVNTYTVQVQTSQALAATDATKIGLANFNSAHFTCDANGFVELAGGGQAIDSFIPNSGTNPVVPAADGSITLQGTGSITTVGGLNSLTPQLTGLTNHNILAGAGTATITNIAPSATSGVPLISQGAAADPTFGTAVVAGGGTGVTSTTAYAVLCGGTTSTNPLQSIASVGNNNDILSSNGAGALPTFKTLATVGGVTTIAGNSGSATPSSGTVTITTGASSAQGTSVFTGSGSTLTQTFSNANNNIGLGATALDSLSSGLRNSAYGVNALTAMTTLSDSTGIGYNALAANTAAQNTAVGSGAAASNTSSGGVTAIGYNALNVSTGNDNTAIGLTAGVAITTGTGNTICGSTSGGGHTTGSFNTILGYSNGASLTTSASRNIFIGTGNTSVGASESNIYLGINLSATESNTLRIGNGTGTAASQLNKAVICGIRGITTGVNDAVAVLVDSANQLGTTSSSRRFKENIVDISNSEKLHSLRPVQFNYPQFSSDRPEYGLIAEEVDSVFPEMVVYDEEGLPQTVQYHKLYGLMLAEIQRLHKRISVLEGK